MTALPVPWCTRKQAADYLQVSDDTIDRNLQEFHPAPIPKKMRFRRRFNPADRIRILSAQPEETNDPSPSP